MYIILMYDIVDDGWEGRKALRKIFKICKKYLHHIQKSVFEGEIKPTDFMRLKAEIQRWIRDDMDSVIVFKTRQEKWLDKEFLGKIESEDFNIL